MTRERFCLFHVASVGLMRVVVYFQFMWRHYLMVARRWELFANFVPGRNGVCVYMRERESTRANENGLRAETWKIDRGCCGIRICLFCNWCFFLFLQFESKSWYGVAVIRFMRVMRGVQMEFGFENIKCVSLVLKNDILDAVWSALTTFWLEQL